MAKKMKSVNGHDVSETVCHKERRRRRKHASVRAADNIFPVQFKV